MNERTVRARERAYVRACASGAISCALYGTLCYCVHTQTRIVLFHPPLCVSGDEIQTRVVEREGFTAPRGVQCYFIARVKGNPPSHTLFLCSTVSLTRYFDDREHVTRAFVACIAPQMHFRGFTSIAKLLTRS